MIEVLYITIAVVIAASIVYAFISKGQNVTTTTDTTPTGSSTNETVGTNKNVQQD